jgi:predicted RNA binding protein YcfA (HicA-like mRNA interferase family)
MTVSNDKNGKGERLGNLKAREIHGALRRMRFEVVRSTTDMIIMRHPEDGRSILVKSARNEEVNKNVLRKILREAKIGERELLAHL